jgi:hypothetical protein
LCVNYYTKNLWVEDSGLRYSRINKKGQVAHHEPLDLLMKYPD